MGLSQQLELAIVECLVQRVSEGDGDGGWPVASFPGSPSPRTNYTRVTFDLAERLREGTFWHVTDDK